MVQYHSSLVKNDLDEILEQSLPWQKLKNTTVLVTGATGMLGSYVGFTLLYLNEQFSLNIKPVFLARSEKKLEQTYGKELSKAKTLVQDVCKPISFNGKVDYIFHAAGAASPNYILSDPVGIINANVIGTQQVLELSRTHQAINTVFASTREVYGSVEGKYNINEHDMGVLDPLNPRNCYPESKRLAEALLMAYHTQYEVNFNSVRIAHTYGPGMQISGDGRVMSDFINDAVNGREILLKSDGQVERAFCYITDAVTGIFRVMLEGKPTQAYNLSNENEPVRIISLANLLQELTNSDKGVKVETGYCRAGYTNYERTALNTNRLTSLGWKPIVSLREGLARTLMAMGGK
ncbi:dTDP-glucose 4,6-dehydratase [Aliidiomarina taiwanensis]|uniref:dTDP-glucose 4,6-dehydratase n=1 Tax=Aliidiomarina taiwanensis TaxID=946228 RepID=A0A432X8Y7_9GAMM|nr:NAD-dependent epimerase/dehydratase family protein [Aliidiomarina taiwanensis]RUO43784.1 dTDP-glucose 4,6-dehydratase [Aliidiomarina taiwanensis]